MKANARPFFAHMKNAVITGSSKGLGRTLAISLAKAGYTVWLSGRSQAELRQLCSEIEATGGRAMFHSVDFADRAATEHYANGLVKECSTVDVLINNAGIYVPDQLTDDQLQLEKQLNVNFFAAHTITQALVPGFIARSGGHIFNICSVVNRAPRTTAASYTISKFALHAYHRLLHQTLLPFGVKVCAFFPSSINTSSWEGSDAPVDEFVQPEDIAAMVLTILKMKRGTVPSEIDLSAINPSF